MISRSSLTTIIAAVVFVFASCNQIEVSEVALHDKDFVTIPVPEKPLHSVNNILEITDVAVIKPDPKISESFVSDLFSVKKILFIDSLYVLLDTKFSIANAYGKNGDYRYSFNKLGVGRGESSLLLDAVLAADQKQIFLVSNKPTKLMKFNQTGELLNETSLTFFPSSMVIPSADTYIYDVNYNYNKISKKNNLLFTDSLSQVKSRGVPLIKSKEDYTFSSPIDC